MAIEVVQFETFEEFLDSLRERPIRLVKLADYGFVAPLRVNSGAIVMAPQVKVVATAFDNKARELLRWQSSSRASSTVTVSIGKAQGSHGDLNVIAKKDDLRKWLELEGFTVSEGEWSETEINQLVSRRAESKPKA